MSTPEIHFPEVIDSSIRGSFVACPRQFFYAHALGLSSKRLSIHLHFGACFAAGLEAFRRAYFPYEGQDLQERHNEALYLGLLTIIREWDIYPADEEPPKTLWSCLGALDYYFETHGAATDSIQPYMKADGKPAVEYSFTLPMEVMHPITKEPLIYAGRFDMLGVYQGSQLMVVDEKTTKQLGASWSSSWDLRAQFKGYAFAARHFGHSVMGALVRGIALRKGGFDHAEAIIPLAEWDLERWWVQLQRDALRMIRCWEENYFDMNLDSSCSSYGGCGFSPLCKVPNPERWIESNYTIRRWNPLLKDPLAKDRAKDRPMLEAML